MQDPTLLQRVERLERANRRWRRAASLGLLAAAALLASGWRRAPDVVEASRVVVRGPDGSEAIALGLDDQRRPSLLLRDKKGFAFLTLSGPGLLLRGEDGKQSCFLGFDAQSAPQLGLTSGRAADGVRLSVQPDGSARCAVLDGNGRERGALAYAAADGSSSVTTKDASGRVRTSLALEDGDKPGLVLLDERGVRRVGMLVDPSEQGAPFLALLDELGRPRVELTTSASGEPSLALRRQDGDPSFRAP